MKSNYRIFTAVFLSAIMTAAAPLTVCGAEVFSAGESSVMERGVFLPY